MIKKFAFVAIVALVSSAANATPICTGTAAPSRGAAFTPTSDVQGSGAGFVVSGFNLNCSANSIVEAQQTSAAAYVSAGSARGRTIYIGSTAGGGVIADPDSAKCPKTGCTTSLVSGAIGNAAALGGGSS